MLDSLQKKTQSSQFDFGNNAFDFLRLFFAIVVVFYHAGDFGGFGLKYSNMYYYPIADWDKGFATLGSLAVYGFFVISGFLITRSADRSSNLWSFLVKRIKRIYPAYFVSLVFTTFVFVPIIVAITRNYGNLRGLSIGVIEYFVRNLFVEIPVTKIANLFVDTEITKSVDKSGWSPNGSYWTLIHEVRAYFLVMLLSVFGFLKSKYPVLVLAILLNLIFVIGIIKPAFRNDIDLIVTDFRLIILFVYFVWGSVFYLYHDKINWNWIGTIFGVLGIIAGIWTNLFGLFAPVCITYLVLFLSQKLPFRNITSKVGDLSYGVYIYSTPIQLAGFYLGLGRAGFVVYFLVTLGVSLLFGYLSYNLVEKRFLIRNK